MNVFRITQNWFWIGFSSPYLNMGSSNLLLPDFHVYMALEFSCICKKQTLLTKKH